MCTCQGKWGKWSVTKNSEKYQGMWNIFLSISEFLSKWRDINYCTHPGLNSLIIWLMSVGEEIGHATPCLFLLLFLGNECPSGSKAQVLLPFWGWVLGMWKEPLWLRAAVTGGWFPYLLLDSFGFLTTTLLFASLSLVGEKNLCFSQ